MPDGTEAAGRQNGLEALGKGEIQDRGREIAVGRLVAADPAANPWENLQEIELVQRKKQPVLRHGKLKNHQTASRLEHAENLAQPLFQMLKVPHSEPHAHAVEAVIGELQRLTVSFQQLNPAVEAEPRHLLAPPGKHSVREVDARNPRVLRASRHGNRKVPRPAGDVEYMKVSVLRQKFPHGATAPYLVNVQRKYMVQSVIFRSDAVKHLLHGFLFRHIVSGVTGTVT